MKVVNTGVKNWWYRYRYRYRGSRREYARGFGMMRKPEPRRVAGAGPRRGTEKTRKKGADIDEDLANAYFECKELFERVGGGAEEAEAEAERRKEEKEAAEELDRRLRKVLGL